MLDAVRPDGGAAATRGSSRYTASREVRVDISVDRNGRCLKKETVDKSVAANEVPADPLELAVTLFVGC